MARPGMVRADTLDLQDQDNPTAAEHQYHPQQNGGIAPHQALELSHVIKERHSEEQSLAEAWNIAGNLTEEPGAIDEAQANHDQEHAANSTHQDGEEGGEGGESEAEGDDDMMDRISSSPSIDDEDIDFEFVYALHTFVATVEGQANATKGDTMVLLDDSNSYWWLVRVVKDSSIGYLPAEHIETPTERLARLNKHRNIDLSATMLSDNSEKSRNPVKKAMRRRKAKTVQFAAPTYVEASDYDYSTEDEEHAMIDPYGSATQAEEPQQNGHVEEPEAAEAKAEDPDERASTPTGANRGSFDREQAATVAPSVEEPQLSPKLIDKTEAAPLKSRKGTPRNTDSFLKDDSIETRKITLTPGLLREDSGGSNKSASTESNRNGSTENLVKTTSPPEPTVAGKKEVKDKKKEKKQGGMLSGLFKSKKKDKKTKADDLGAESDMEKPSLESMRVESPRASPVPSGNSSPVAEKTNALASPPAVEQQRQLANPAANKQQQQQQQQQPPARGKLQKQQPTTQQFSSARERPNNDTQSNNSFFAELAGSEVAHEMATGQESAIITEASHQVETPSVESAGTMASIKNMLTPASSSSAGEREEKPEKMKKEKAKRAKQRVELDDFDSPAEEEEEGPNPFEEQEERRRVSAEDTKAVGGGAGKERLSESPVEIMPGTFMHGTEIVHIPMPGDGEAEEEEEQQQQHQPESLTSSPSIIDHPTEQPVEEEDRDDAGIVDEEEAGEDNEPTPTGPRSPQPLHTATDATTLHKQQQQQQQPTIPPTRELSTDSTITDTSSSSFAQPSTPSVREQTWSDSSLRSWLDDGTDVRDMLVLIHDKSGVQPISPDHPMMAGLFVEQRKGVEKMMVDLDGLLGNYLTRKGISFA